MKILHLGDLHIGKSVNDYSMIDDQKYILDQILEITAQKEIDAVFIAGDVYDRAVPSEEAVRVFDYFICELAERHIQAYIISGNHDSDERLHFGSALFQASGIYIASKYDGTLFRHTVEDEYGIFNIYLLPFVKASQVKHFFPEADIDSYDKAVRVILENARIDEKERNVLIAHQFVAGKSGGPVPGGSENAAVQNVGTVEKIGTDCFDIFDYTALGHIHSPQKIGRDTIRYSGSPLKYSLSEIENEKSVPVVTFGRKGEVDIELVSLKPRHDMRRLRGRMNQLLDLKNIEDPEDYIYVTLTDEEPVSDAITIIRQYYPNTMKLDYENSHTKGAEQLDLTEATRKKSFQELIADFYAMRFGCEISAEEMEIMLEAAGKAGMADETDETGD